MVVLDALSTCTEVITLKLLVAVLGKERGKLSTSLQCSRVALVFLVEALFLERCLRQGFSLLLTV